jgi:hypothetical protein
MIHHWDFFGVDAKKTAEHFLEHYKEFAQRLSIATSDFGFLSASEQHVCLWISITDTTQSSHVEKKLRPRRTLDEAEHQQLLQRVTDALRSPPEQ